MNDSLDELIFFFFASILIWIFAFISDECFQLLKQNKNKKPARAAVAYPKYMCVCVCVCVCLCVCVPVGVLSPLPGKTQEVISGLGQQVNFVMVLFLSLSTISNNSQRLCFPHLTPHVCKTVAATLDNTNKPSSSIWSLY